jgi:hypothetical protein
LLTVREPNPYTEINGRAPTSPDFQEIPPLAKQDNKLVRLAKDRREKKKLAVVEGQLSVEDYLARLEEDIRRLKIEFDIYFNGGSKRPPYDTKMRVESHLKRLGDDRSLTFAQRYYYNSLATRYASFRELWRRMMQGREESGPARGSVVDSTPFTRSEFSCGDVRHEVQTIKGVYDALVKAKRSCGEPIHGLSFARFHRMVLERSDALKEKAGADRVTFSVDVEGGHVSFKAKPEK